MSLYFSAVQKQIITETLHDRYLMLVDMAASAAECGDIHSHDIYSDEYCEISQIIKKLRD